MLNPIVYTEKVVDDFLKYHLTVYPFADGNLYEQMRTLLNLEITRATPLLKGLYISLSRIFKLCARGGSVITFPEGKACPQLWLSAEDASSDAASDNLFRTLPPGMPYRNASSTPMCCIFIGAPIPV